MVVGGCVVAGGPAWLVGVCVVAGGWGGMHGCGGERAVRILLECILVYFYFSKKR